MGGPYDVEGSHDGHGVRVVVRAALALTGRLTAPPGLAGPGSSRHLGRPLGVRGRVLPGGGRCPAVLDKLPDQLAQLGPCGHELAKGRVLAPQVALGELRGRSGLVARCKWSFWASPICESGGTSLRYTRRARSPSRPGVEDVTPAKSAAVGVVSPAEWLPGVSAAPSRPTMGTVGVATSPSRGAGAWSIGQATMGIPCSGPWPTASVEKRRTGWTGTRNRRERSSREGGGSRRRTDAQTRVADISRKFGVAVEGGTYPAGTPPRRACSTAG